MLTYADALAYLYHFTDYEKRAPQRYAPEFYDPARVEGLLDQLGNPQRCFRSVHIAGTKGKGSTAAMIASILKAAGLRTGLFTSPHLHTFRERIRIDGELIAESEVAAGVERLCPFADGIAGVTTFEVVTAVTFDHFARQAIDFAVLEVGMGGRLDATNVIVPEVAVITSLSYDHTQILGSTLAQIAREKAGIIKPGVPVVSAPQAPEALAVIEATCCEKDAPLILVGRDWLYEAREATLEGQSFKVVGQDAILPHIPPRHSCDILERTFQVPLLGRHQVVNATAAIAAVEELRKRGITIADEHIAEGLRRVEWPGRFEILSREPFVVVDGAHNVDSARQLVVALCDYFPGRRIVLVFGASADKDIVGMLAELLSGARALVATSARNPRAAPPERIIDAVGTWGGEVYTCPDVAAALEQALWLAGSDNVVCITGSLFVVAEARQAWFERQGNPLPASDPL